MKILVTGSSGHLGEALLHELAREHEVVGLDARPAPGTTHVGSVADADLVRRALAGVDAVLHTATLHKPHVATHPRQAFVDTNISGTLTLLEESVAAGVGAFVFTSTTSAYGRALVPEGAAPAVWVVEALVPQPKNIYGVTKLAAENLCELVWRREGLPCLILRTSRFFPEPDDDAAARAQFDDANLKTNELLNRRVELDDVVAAHVCALAQAARIGFGRYVVSATTPFRREDAAALRTHAAEVVARYVPQASAVYAARGWQLPADIGRVYDNRRARDELGWRPRTDFAAAVERLRGGAADWRSGLVRRIGMKGYHDGAYGDGVYPVDAPADTAPRTSEGAGIPPLGGGGLPPRG